MENAKIYQALCAINKEVEAIKKDQKNEQQGFKFRGIDGVMNELHNLFAKHEVIIIPIVEKSDVSERTNKNGTLIFHTRLNVSYDFCASDGTKITATAIGEAMDSGDKGINKAMSIALKYVLLQMFLIPTQEDKDPDSKSHEAVDYDLITAMDDLKKAKSVEDVKSIWDNWPKYQHNSDFIKLTKEMKGKFA